MVELIISTMPARGKRGYVAKIDGSDKKFLREEDRTGYGSSHIKLTYKIAEDGIYEVQDANFGSSKVNRYFLHIENGESIQESESLSELILSESAVEMPELEGSPKQIAWAEDIRGKYAAKLLAAGKKVPSQMYCEVSAKFYIDNRNNLWVLKDLPEEKTESIAGAAGVVKDIKWIDTCPDDCRHESGAEDDGYFQGIVTFGNGKSQKVEVLEFGKEVPPGDNFLGIEWRRFKSGDEFRWCYPLGDFPCWIDEI